MIQKSYFQVASQQVTLGPVGLVKIGGNYCSAADRFIQLHDSNTVPAEGSVPVRSYPVTGGTAAEPITFFESFIAAAREFVNGIYVCISSTDGTKTIDAAALMDVFIEVNREDPFLNASIAGDKSSPVFSLSVWNEASGPKKLLQVEASANNGTPSVPLYVMVFATDNPVNGDKPIVTGTTALTNNDNNFVTLKFGDGLSPCRQTSDFVNHRGCSIWFSESAVSLIKTQVDGYSGTLRAYYK